jgi:replication factor A1
MNHKKPAVIEFLAFLSVKNGIYLSEIYQALVVARAKQKTKCRNLTLEYRGSVKNEAIFLITNGTAVVAQFRMGEELLQRKDICFENWMDTDKIRKQLNRRMTKESVMVQDMRDGMKRVNLQVQILETPPASTVQTLYGNSSRLTNVLVADETGKIKLCLWNEQADFVNVGDTVQIRDAAVSTFKGERQLRLGRKGTITIIQKDLGRIKQDLEVTEKNSIYA